jgi:hypothetical protein
LHAGFVANRSDGSEEILFDECFHRLG